MMISISVNPPIVKLRYGNPLLTPSVSGAVCGVDSTVGVISSSACAAFSGVAEGVPVLVVCVSCGVGVADGSGVDVAVAVAVSVGSGVDVAGLGVEVGVGVKVGGMSVGAGFLGDEVGFGEAVGVLVGGGAPGARLCTAWVVLPPARKVPMPAKVLQPAGNPD